MQVGVVVESLSTSAAPQEILLDLIDIVLTYIHRYGLESRYCLLTYIDEGLDAIARDYGVSNYDCDLWKTTQPR